MRWPNNTSACEYGRRGCPKKPKHTQLGLTNHHQTVYRCLCASLCSNLCIETRSLRLALSLVAETISPFRQFSFFNRPKTDIPWLHRALFAKIKFTQVYRRHSIDFTLQAIQ